MKKIFYSHPDTVIAALALVFFGVLVAFYSWASNVIFTEVHQSLTFSPTSQENSFNIAAAQSLDLRGLLGSTPPPASTTTEPSVSVPATSDVFVPPSSTTSTPNTPRPNRP